MCIRDRRGSNLTKSRLIEPRAFHPPRRLRIRFTFSLPSIDDPTPKSEYRQIRDGPKNAVNCSMNAPRAPYQDNRFDEWNSTLSLRGTYPARAPNPTPIPVSL